MKAHLQTYPCPLNINFLWNFGFLLAMLFVLQILSGILLTSHYTPDVTSAFYSVQYILREVGSGWYFRYLHAVGASFLFVLLYLHMARSVINGSYFYLSTVWISGLVLFLMFIIIAFLGYILPWGQMSFWGATVITNILSPIPGLVSWLCGGYYVSNPTLKRFFVLHFVLPFVCFVLIILHVFYLHLNGSNNPLGYDTALKIPFMPNILSLDLKGFNSLFLLVLAQTFFGFLVLSHPDNSCEVNRFVTPLQIVPEWYFLPFYAVLKVIPSKNSGCLLTILVIQCMYVLIELRTSTTQITIKNLFNHRNYSFYGSWLQCAFYSLLWVGAQLPQEVFICYGRIFLISYFVSLVVLLGVFRYRDERCVQGNLIRHYFNCGCVGVFLCLDWFGTFQFHIDNFWNLSRFSSIVTK